MLVSRLLETPTRYAVGLLYLVQLTLRHLKLSPFRPYTPRLADPGLEDALLKYKNTSSVLALYLPTLFVIPLISKT